MVCIVAIICTALLGGTTLAEAFFLPRHTSNNIIQPRQPRRGHQQLKTTTLYGIKGFRSWFESAFPSSLQKVQHPPPVNRKKVPPKNRGKIKPHKRNNNKQYAEVEPEIYDHVLIDGNQFLHSGLRKAFNRKLKRSKGSTAQFDGENLDDDLIEYSLLLLIQELNRLTSTVAIPRKSLVIAIDGSPGAAKLEMQRRRRFGLYKKVELQQKLLDVLRERGWSDSQFGFAKKNNNNNKITLLSKHERDKVTMNITPGTAYLDRVTEALLYWSWRSVANPTWPMSRSPKSDNNNNNNKPVGKVKIYISPSMVPGEGEIKLLDFMMRGQLPSDRGRKTIHPGESVAFIGGDSDLVLMGLCQPPSVTQNVHVILPGEHSKTLIISIWETTRHLVGMLEGTATYRNHLSKGSTKQPKRKLTDTEMQQARMDAVLLIILNGNDYLPKLRYSGTFDTFFEVYLNLMKRCMAKRDSGYDDDDDGEVLKPFLIDIDKDGISLNVPFAIQFFREMAAQSGPKSPDVVSTLSSSSQQTHLGYLNNFVEAGFLPGPVNIETIAPKESLYQMQLNVTLEEVFGDDVEIVRLTLGDFPALNTDELVTTTLVGESDGHGVISRMIRSDTDDRSYLFEIPHKRGFPVKNARLRLARIALEEVFGKDNFDDLFGDEDNDDEIMARQLSPAEPKSYLGGLLFTLETYRTGVCADYGYNYGRKSSPSASDLVSLLQEEHGKEKITRQDLIDDSNASPLSDGLSCLAALPPQAHSILEEPYSWLVQPSSRANFEEMYNSCFEEGVFDAQLFADKCSKEISNIRSIKSITKKETAWKRRKKSDTRGRHILTSAKYWTVLSISKDPLIHPFSPPEPFSDRTPRLKMNKRVKASKLSVSHTSPPPDI